MTLLLNPRVWLCLLLAAVLGFTHIAAYRKGQHEVRAEWTAATAAADAESRRLEQARQRRADEAAQMAAARESRIRADAVHARTERDGLRDDLRTVNEYAKESRAAAERVADAATGLLGRCAETYLGVAEDAARADSEARQLRQGWPK